MFTTESEFYKIVNNIVRLSRTPNYDERGIRCFAVINRYRDIDDEQVTKILSEKDKIYFYSKLWGEQQYPTNEIKFDYPLLAIRHNTETKNNFYRGSGATTSSFDILLVDRYIEQDAMPNPYNQRNVFEIQRDCRILLIGLLKTIGTVRAYKYNSGTEILYLPEMWVNSQDDSNLYIVDQMKTSKLNQGLKLINDFVIEDFWGGGNNLYGVLINNFTLPLDNCYYENIPMNKDSRPI